MSFGDVWHRTLVYFGIAEEYDDGWDEEYMGEEMPSSGAAAPVEPVYADRSSANVRRLPRRFRDSGTPGRGVTSRPMT